MAPEKAGPFEVNSLPTLFSELRIDCLKSAQLRGSAGPYLGYRESIRLGGGAVSRTPTALHLAELALHESYFRP